MRIILRYLMLAVLLTALAVCSAGAENGMTAEEILKMVETATEDY